MKRPSLSFIVKKTGLPPGTIVTRPEAEKNASTFILTEYNANKHNETTLSTVKTLPKSKKTRTTWIDCIGAASKEILLDLGKRYDINPLTLEDIANLSQLPKFEHHDDSIFIVLKAIEYKNEQLHIETISFFLKDSVLLSFQEKETDTFDTVKSRIRNGRGSIRNRKADYLLYCLMDFVVDTYFIALKEIDAHILALEEEIELNQDLETLKRIQLLNKSLSQMKRHYWYIRDVVMDLKRLDIDLVSENIDIFWSDLNDHLTHVIDISDNFKLETLALSERFQSIQAQRTNDVAQKLTIIAATFLPLSLITGIYGMNFQWMPELSYHYGYPLTLLAMISIVVVSFLVFKLKKWF